MIRPDFEARCTNGSDIHAHMQRLHDEASIPGVQVIELGVRSGNSTAAFLTAAEEHDGHVWSVDIAPPHTPTEWRHTGRWTVIVNDDLVIVDELPNQVDVVFIDTSHTYDQTLAELHAYAPKVRPGGVILLHDTELEHPEASPPSDPPFPVRSAIDAWWAEIGHLVADPPEYVTGCYGLGVIQIGAT